MPGAGLDDLATNGQQTRRGLLLKAIFRGGALMAAGQVTGAAFYAGDVAGYYQDEIEAQREVARQEGQEDGVRQARLAARVAVAAARDMTLRLRTPNQGAVPAYLLLGTVTINDAAGTSVVQRPFALGGLAGDMLNGWFGYQDPGDLTVWPLAYDAETMFVDLDNVKLPYQQVYARVGPVGTSTDPTQLAIRAADYATGRDIGDLPALMLHK